MTKSRNSRSRRSQARTRNGSNQAVSISRTLLLGSVPAGNGSFEGSTILPVYPLQDTIGPIAQGYSEYKFTRFVVTLIPRCSTSTLGTKWVGISYGLPVSFSTLAQVYSLSRFSVTQAYGQTGSTSLVPGNSRLRWYPVIPGAPTAAQLTNPDFVQAYIYLGTQGVQSGVVSADIKVSYTIQLRGPVGAGGVLTPATTGVAATSLPLSDGGGVMIVSASSSQRR